MTDRPDYRRDAEFTKLLARRSDVDLTLVALELARDAHPGIEFRTTLDWLDARAAEISGAVARAKDDRDALRVLANCLAETHGIIGDEAAYDDADGSCLNRVIETGRGLPITLSILYMALAERVRIDLKGVSAPRHFLTRYESAEGPLFLDAYSEGRVLDEQECARWLCDVTGLSSLDVAAALQPVGPRTIVIRMLNNLKALYARYDNWPAAWIVQRRLSALQPGSYQERRDLALISLRANRPGQAIDLLQSCLRTCPVDEKPALLAQLEEASGQLARWN